MNEFDTIFNYGEISDIEKDVAAIDLRGEFKLLNAEYGVTMLYIRSNK